MPNSTIKKFGYPDSLVGETDHWVVLLRPKQVTVGCVVLACKEDATSLGELSPKAGEEFPVACEKLERSINEAFSPDKFNYLALMMVDPHVHFHVIPRYSGAKEINGVSVPDNGWPKHPRMDEVAELTDEQMEAILHALRDGWR